MALNINEEVYLRCEVCGTKFLHKWPHTFAGTLSQRMGVNNTTTNLCELHFKKLIKTACAVDSPTSASANKKLPLGSIPFEMEITYTDQTNTDFTKTFNLIYSDVIDRLRLSFPNNGKIKIKLMSINGNNVKNFKELISLDDDIVHLEIGSNRDRFTFNPMTFSKDKKTLIAKNETQYINTTYPPNGDTYDYIALGCSVTYGVGIRKEEAWPSLLEKEGKQVMNISVPGGGIDVIFLNAIELIRKKIKFSKMIILLPNLHRYLARTYKHGYYFNNLILPNVALDKNHATDDTNFNIYLSAKDEDSILKKGLAKLVLGDAVKRNTMIIRRMVNLFNKNSIEFRISSWNDETYDILKACVPNQNLLPKFNEENDLAVGFDKDHPAGKIHSTWTNKIKSQIEGLQK